MDVRPHDCQELRGLLLFWVRAQADSAFITREYDINDFRKCGQLRVTSVVVAPIAEKMLPSSAEVSSFWERLPRVGSEHPQVIHGVAIIAYGLAALHEKPPQASPRSKTAGTPVSAIYMARKRRTAACYTPQTRR